MKKPLTILTILIMIFAYSCKEDKPTTDISSKTNFDIDNVHYVSTKTTSYQTDFGQLLKVIGENFELYIVLSDKDNKIFNITDTLSGLDVGKARCIFKMNNDFKFSNSGTIEYDLEKKSGTFTVNIEGLNFKNGLIKVDTIINNAIVDFSNITETDEIGVPMNMGDANDWCIRTNWEVIERLVFNLKPVTTLSNAIKLIEYPNPINGIFILHLDIPSECKADLFLINTNYEIEQKFIGLQPGRVMMQLNNTLIKGHYYRLCYNIYSNSEQFYGSGDLKLQN